MKIAFISEMFLPFAPGGAEWSTFYLAKDLTQKGHQIIVITPNYGTASQENLSNVNVKRFPFYSKLKNTNKFPGNFFFTNPLWYLWSSIMYSWYLLRENPDIIHVHGKYSIPPIFIANILLRKPILSDNFKK